MELDQLSLGITASDRKASESIDRLINKLGSLSNALNNVSGRQFYVEMNVSAQGVMALANAAQNVDAAKLKNVASALNSLARASAKMSASAEGMRQLAGGFHALESVDFSRLSALGTLASAFTRMGGETSGNAAYVIPQIAQSLQSFSGISVPDVSGISNLAIALRSLGSKNITQAAMSLPFIADGLQRFSGITLPDMAGLQEFAKSLSLFGRKTAQTAVTTIPQLATAFQELIDRLSHLPPISQNTIDFANAMANLANSGGMVPSQMKSASLSLSSWSSATKKAHKHTLSLAAAMGKLYASFFLIIRAGRMLGQAIGIASDLTEVQNVVDVAFGDMKYKMEDFASTARQEFGMTELQAKQFGSRFQAMGSAMGITNEQVRRANTFLGTQGLTGAYSNLGDSMADVSITLTKLTADMGSFYNTEYTDVAEDLQAILTGMSRPLRTYGLDLTNATLREFALRNGLNADIQSMSQAEKTMLRYQYVLANTTNAQGDFARTANTWANQIRILKQNFQALGAVIGQGFINILKPAVMALNRAMNTIISLVQKTINALGRIFGWQIEISEVGIADDMGDYAGSAADAADALGGAAENAKKLKDYTLGIDELNIFHPDEDSDGGGGGGGAGGGASGGGGGRAKGGDLSVTKIPYESPIDNLYDLGKAITDWLADAMESIDWPEIFYKAKRAGEMLAEFMNGMFDNVRFWVDLGHTLANALNTALIFLHNWLINSHWFTWGENVGKMINEAIATFSWSLLGRTIADGLNAAFAFALGLGLEVDLSALGAGIATSINNFFLTFDFQQAADALNTWVDNLGEFISGFLAELDAETVFSGLTTFFVNLEPDTVVAIIGIGVLKTFGTKFGQTIAKHIFDGIMVGFEAVFLHPVLLVKTIATMITSGALIPGTPTFDVLANQLIDRISDSIQRLLPEGVYNTLNEALGGAFFGVIIGGVFLGPIGALAGAIVGALTGGIAAQFDLPAVWEEFKTKVSTSFTNAFGDINWWELTAQKWAETQSLFEQGGTHIVEGVLSGIETGISLITEPIKKFCDAVVAFFKQLFGIASPATEMMPIGEDIVLGIFEGFSLVDFATKMTEWWDLNVAPWFTLEKWLEVSQGIYDGISQKWAEFVEWWQTTGLYDWWENDVLPWFTVDKWLEITAGIKEGIEAKWNEFTEWWRSTGFHNWWVNDVTPKFTATKWTFDGMRAGLVNKLNEAISQMTQLLNSFIEWAASALAGLIPEEWTDPNRQGLLPRPNAPKQAGGVTFHANGGYPTVGSMFIAGEAGAEFVGNIGGRTGVVNTDQMAASVAAGNAQVVSVLLQVVDAIVSKDVSVNIGDRDIAMAANRGQSAIGRQIITG